MSRNFNWKLNWFVIFTFLLPRSCSILPILVCSTVSHSVSHHNFLFHNCHQDTYFDFFSRNESGLTRFIYSLYKVNSSCRMYVFVLVSWSRMCVERRAITHDQPTKWQYSQWREKSWLIMESFFFVVSLIFLFHFLASVVIWCFWILMMIVNGNFLYVYIHSYFCCMLDQCREVEFEVVFRSCSETIIVCLDLEFWMRQTF